MPAKFIRISERTVFHQRLQDFLHKKINIVLLDNTTVAGELTGTSADSLEVKNGLLKIVSIPLKHIDEVYVEEF